MILDPLRVNVNHNNSNLLHLVAFVEELWRKNDKTPSKHLHTVSLAMNKLEIGHKEGHWNMYYQFSMGDLREGEGAGQTIQEKSRCRR